MGQKEDIGKLIKKQFKGVDVSPEDLLWDKIDATLQKRKRKRRALLFLLFIIAAIGLSTYYYTNYNPSNVVNNSPNSDLKNESSPTNSMTETHNTTNQVGNTTDQENISNQENLEKVNRDTLTQENDKSPQKIFSEQFLNKGKSKTNKSKNTTQNKEEYTQASNKELTETSTTSKTDNSDTIIQDTVLDTLNKTKNLKENFPQNTARQKRARIQKDSTNSNEKTIDNIDSKKWALTITGGVSYLNSFNRGSIIDSRLDTYNREGTLDFSYGLAIRFELSNKFAVSYGANKSTFSYETQNVPSSDEIEINRILSYTDRSFGNTTTSAEVSNFLDGENQTDLLHQIEYIEMPLLMHYKLIDKRLGIHTIGGFSTYLLNKDHLYVKNDQGKRLKIGDSKNLIATRFSINLGVGAYYTISDNFMIELNPTLKYNFTKISSRSNGDNPFVIGVFTGLTYKIF
ncbi:hypothetical protein [Planktosalinus lacus]|uniref:Outer membrane protein beta-barrel domain-containing protein n=1 Tax=Planktosalinus lacus TaxID=1526573 RepID=A0A8J2V9S0_9FLAO|nr:hypothetical protein [Planktosalinus lacus]GGD89070.1 hypothetical protein GCM10011312_11180 [Planktosalinus lacus]